MSDARYLGQNVRVLPTGVEPVLPHTIWTLYFSTELQETCGRLGHIKCMYMYVTTVGSNVTNLLYTAKISFVDGRECVQRNDGIC